MIRTCGSDDSEYKDKCYRRSGFGGDQQVCACSNLDNCNAADTLKSSIIILPVIIALGTYLWR